METYTLYRIIYTDEFIESYKKMYNVSLNKKGGWIESEDNLAQHGYAIIIDNAMVTDNARVRDNAIVKGNVIISNNLWVDGHAVIDNISISNN